MIVQDKDNMIAMFDVQLDPDSAFATPEINDMLAELNRIKRQVKLLQDNETALSGKIKEFMGAKEALIDRDGTVAATYKSYEGVERLHVETLKCIFPDIYKECLAKADSFRRFLLK